MITKVYQLGAYAKNIQMEENPLGLNTTLEKGNVILLKFHINDDICNYVGATTMEFDSDINKKILLKNTKGNKVSEFPTIYLDAQNPDKSIKKLTRILKNCENVSHHLERLLNEFEKNSDVIKNELANKKDDDSTNLISVMINDRLITDSSFWTPIIDKAKEERFRAYYEKYGTTSFGEDAACYICGRDREQVWGFVNTFNFYSANELSWFSGNWTFSI